MVVVAGECASGETTHMNRVAQCACGRLSVTVDGEPEDVVGCHCDHCLRRSGSAYPVVAWFNRSQIAEVSGDSTVFNGLEVNGVAGPGGLVNYYNFCPTCGSTVYWTFDEIPESFPEELAKRLPNIFVIPVGSFADPNFPPPDRNLFPELRPTWLHPYPTAD